MYEPYGYGEPMDEGGYRVKPRYQLREDLISSSRLVKKASGWVFISRKADIGILLVLLLSVGLGITWLITQLPVFLEAASNHYHWALDVYATWGTPSMRWLFINLVVGVIVATSGLLSAFGGDSNSRPEAGRSSTGYDKGVSYRGPDPGATYGGSPAAYNAQEARFAGPGYEYPLYNPHGSEAVKPVSELRHESSFEAWNNRNDERDWRGREEDFRSHAAVDEPYARPVDPAEVMRAARPVFRQGSVGRGVPIIEEGPMLREVPREPVFDTPRDLSGEVLMSREIPREMPTDTFRAIHRDMERAESPSRESLPSREIPEPTEAPGAEKLVPPSPVPEPEASDATGVGSSCRKEDAVEIISKVYDPVPELVEFGPEPGRFQRLKTDPSIHYAPVDEVSAKSSPAKHDILHKSHTFTLGRVMRRDQLADFIEPLSRKLEGFGRKVRLDKTSHAESTSQAKELPGLSPVAAGAAIGAESCVALPDTHRRGLSTESIPVITHIRRLSSEAVAPTDGSIQHLSKQISAAVDNHQYPSVGIEPSPPPSPPLLKQRSIVYPPALLSQASNVEDLSPPNSPPIDVAIPPPPPPHLKLPLTKDSDNSITSSEELSSFKFYVSPSHLAESAPEKLSKKWDSDASPREDSRALSNKNCRPSSTHIFSSSQSTGTLESGSSSVKDQRTLMVKARQSNAGNEKVLQSKEGIASDRQEKSSVKDDDLHQQIEDFLARFHENWRLQRQESLARYKKRLVELDE